ncbi:MAG: glutamine-hydrolyzing GMP synthase [Candidatus Neomarinimicrobiota bacterium]|nr:glutamine-hydrolyzing GMP synthase [Candidatus Neomarinimicrobiota bacterium]
MRNHILIIDFGSQYTQLIARRIRENNVFCEIVPFSVNPDIILDKNPIGLILSGGPSSVYNKDAPKISNNIMFSEIPILGICYGMQLIIRAHGGRVGNLRKREYGVSELIKNNNSKLFHNISPKSQVWMSHGDHMEKCPEKFKIDAISKDKIPSAISSKTKDIYGIQFHPEVSHTSEGNQLLKNFIFKICNANRDWTAENFIKSQVQYIREKVGDAKVICGVSGGVDSTVTVKLLSEAIDTNVIPVFIDNGLLRKNEFKYVKQIFKNKLKIPLFAFKSGTNFLSKLKNVTNPEHKRKIIGKEFIRTFEEISKKYKNLKYLAQGTLYPDIIESVSVNGPSVTIKSHHNVGGLPKKLNLKLIEPLRELFKDEVRHIGRLLNIPDDLIDRHPFPGPGLSIRIIGKITKQKLKLLREADAIFIDELHQHQLYHKTWQAFAVLLPVKSVGVMGDKRTYQRTIVLRAVSSNDGMTAEWTEFPYYFLKRVSTRIVNEVPGINRVLYDISNKPPGTIEWE